MTNQHPTGMSHYYTWKRISHAMRKVMQNKTTPDVTAAILEDLFDELSKPLKPTKGQIY